MLASHDAIDIYDSINYNTNDTALNIIHPDIYFKDEYTTTTI
jgi:hypothetical protein